MDELERGPIPPKFNYLSDTGYGIDFLDCNVSILLITTNGPEYYVHSELKGMKYSYHFYNDNEEWRIYHRIGCLRKITLYPPPYNRAKACLNHGMDKSKEEYYGEYMYLEPVESTYTGTLRQVDKILSIYSEYKTLKLSEMHKDLSCIIPDVHNAISVYGHTTTMSRKFTTKILDTLYDYIKEKEYKRENLITL
jgi:hypothetical protein